MCHLALLMPVLGISLFWLMPLGLDIPSYAVLLAVSGLVYWTMIEAMKKRRDTFHGLVGTEAEVADRSELASSTQYLVRAYGELWTARSTEILQMKERVRVMALNGVTLVVERRSKHK